mmetsp:Transcript_92551/g.238926  ORF Transcript_92551/g.238926 Transcript_92551/m.238926 type:complete len:257 (+) Transcript_92551:244-1014(+)
MVAIDELVRHTVRNHDLRAAQLVLGGVDVTAEDLVQGSAAGQHHGSVDGLDGALAEAVQVGADAHGASGDVGEGEDLVVRTRRLSCDQTAALQVLHADASGRRRQALAHDGLERVDRRAALLLHLARHDRALRQLLVVLRREVEVLEAFARVRGVVPLHVDLGHELFHQAQPRTAIARQVNARQALRARVRRDLLEEGILGDAEGAGLVRHIVRDEDDGAALGALRRLHYEAPGEHAVAVGVRRGRGRLMDGAIRR